MNTHTPTLADLWIDDEGSIAHGHGDEYVTLYDAVSATPADTERIVRACNAHDALVEALRLMYDNATGLSSREGRERAVTMARAALAGEGE